MSPQYKAYPAFFFHATLGSRRVMSFEEQSALGPGWFDHPSKCVAHDTVDATTGAVAEIVAAEEPLEIDLVKQMHDLPASKVVPLIEQMEDLEQLAVVMDLETQHPVYMGGRQVVMKAIKARFDAVTKARVAEFAPSATP